jgi:hypothetical protein
VISGLTIGKNLFINQFETFSSLMIFSARSMKRFFSVISGLTIGKNLFIDLAEKIIRELNVSNCWICGGALMSEK